MLNTAPEETDGKTKWGIHGALARCTSTLEYPKRLLLAIYPRIFFGLEKWLRAVEIGNIGNVIGLSK